MRILQVGKYYHPTKGGIETVLRCLAEGLVADGHDVTVLCFAAGRQGGETVQDGVTVIRAPTYGSVLSQPLAPAFRRLLHRAAAAADVVHVHSPNPLAELHTLRGRSPVPVVCTYHADVTRQRIALPAYRPLLRRFLASCAQVLVATDRHITFSPVLMPIADKCSVIPFGIDPARFQPGSATPQMVAALRERLGDFVLFVGRLVGYKGLPVLIEAMRGLPNHLVIVGEGPLAARLGQQIAAAGLGDRVHLVGAVADDAALLAYYRACRVFALPSLTPAEAFGMVLLEAMACGKPLVTSRLDSGVTFVNQDGVNGLHVTPGDPGELRAALAQLLADAELSAHLGAQGRARFETEFTTGRMIAAHAACYAALKAAGSDRRSGRSRPRSCRR